MDSTFTALALGMFDGVHTGHKALLRKTTELASSEGGNPAVFTFSNHPCEAFGRKPVLLTSMEERNALIRAEGIVNVITVPFTKAFASMEPEAFLRYLMQTVRPDCLICGFNYTFGSGGKGDASLLKLRESEYGYKVYEVPPVLYDGMPVSSTRIRSCVESGRMEEAGRMLGRRYSLTGKMDASGGFYPDPCRAVPAFGTFDVTVFSEDGSRHGAVVSFDHGTGLMRGEGMRSGAAELIFGCGQNSSL